MSAASGETVLALIRVLGSVISNPSATPEQVKDAAKTLHILKAVGTCWAELISVPDLTKEDYERSVDLLRVLLGLKKSKGRPWNQETLEMIPRVAQGTHSLAFAREVVVRYHPELADPARSDELKVKGAELLNGSRRQLKAIYKKLGLDPNTKFPLQVQS